MKDWILVMAVTAVAGVCVLYSAWLLLDVIYFEPRP